jgi:hypothetical protein
MSAPAALGRGRLLSLDARRVGLQARQKAALSSSVDVITRAISQIA